MDNFNDVVHVLNRKDAEYKFSFGKVCAVDTSKKLMKIITEPDGKESAWSKAFKGAFTDEIGTEVVLMEVGNLSGQSIVCGIIDN